MKMDHLFRNYAPVASDAVGSAWAFFGACALVALWAATGPLLRFSDTWQLIINTGTSILTFLIVFLIQYAQNRDTRAIHLKLDKILLTIGSAQNSVLDLDKFSEEQMTQLEELLRRRRQQIQEQRVAPSEHA